ncbi:MAG: 5-formyltetrahydrofolate cyclo-ligase, partial [Desulfurococcales archaeon]|nr:5-formyltetrahydrofolate cyclo-ligase [Desulfurococcales archaeon]
MDIDSVRARIRETIWRLLEEKGEARPPLPVRGRIPNFRGAEEAARRLASTEEWERARVVKVNPDSPQRPVRYLALSQGKMVVMPTPRIRRGFILLDPGTIPRRLLRRASTIRGAFSLGRLLPGLDDIERLMPRIDLIVEGSVAVDRECNRLGKGEGYGDLEYALLLLVGKVG